MPEKAAVVVASNRGPLSFVAGEDGFLSLRRAAGGLVSGLSGAISGGNLVWVCAALTADDRIAARTAPGGRLDLVGHDTGGTAVRMLDIEETTFHRAYNAVANSTLWFVNHMLYDTPIAPSFDARFAREWQAYVDYNAAFADALAEEAAPGGQVLVQDYHLTLAPSMLRERRPDLRIGHFMHTPWASPAYFSLLPDRVAREVLEGILGAATAGFLSPRWARAFLECCESLLGADVDWASSTVTYAGRPTVVATHPLGIDADALRHRAHQADVEARIRVLDEQVGHRSLIVRIDRTELSKNIVRGLEAYRELLRTEPSWCGQVVHAVFAYPSRHDLPVYREYTARVQRVAQEIEDEFATSTWSPLLLEVNDDFARSLAAYRKADVLVVNPIRDGMNLVAKEGPVISDEGCALVLSREAGAADALSEDAFVVNPYDVSQTASAIDQALRLSRQERASRCQRLAKAASALPPSAWIAAQLAALD